MWLAFAYSIFCAVALLSALTVVFSRHPVHSALALVVTMISVAGIFVLINAQLAAILQVLVYAGAIMVLFLFVIMMLNLTVNAEPSKKTRLIRRIGVVLFAVFLIQGSILAIRFGRHFEIASDQMEMISVADVGMVLMTKYLYAFEMTSIMLLVAVIGAMVLARRSIAPPQARSRESRG